MIFLRNSLKTKNDELTLIASFDDENKKKIYINKHGNWFLKMDKKFYDLNDEKYYLFCLTMLETPFDEIILQLRKNENIALNPVELFPFIHIIKYAFKKDLYTQHWVDLALNWINKMERDAIVVFKDELHWTVSDKFFSQQVRHKAMKELAKMK